MLISSSQYLSSDIGGQHIGADPLKISLRTGVNFWIDKNSTLQQVDHPEINKSTIFESRNCRLHALLRSDVVSLVKLSGSKVVHRRHGEHHARVEDGHPAFTNGYVAYKGVPTFVKQISTVVESRSD
jgi:hypothetical protein